MQLTTHHSPLTTHQKVFSILFFLLAHSAIFELQAAMDYNGNPINRGGSFTITPNTLPSVLASYTQSINTNGLLDKTFGTVGSTTTPIGDGTDTKGYAVALQQDGKIVVAGRAHVADGGGQYQFAVARYTTAGILDPLFGTNGSTTTPIGDGTDTEGYAVALQQDGKIVVAGYAHVGGAGGHLQFAVARYTTAGILDPLFGTNGSTTTPIGDGTDTEGYAVALQQDGKIVVAGYASVGGHYQFAVARYTTAGILDPLFGTNGSTTTPIGDGTDTEGQAIALQQDGKIVVAGTAHVADGGGQYQFAVARYTTAGILDPSFGTNGSTTTPIGNGTNTQAHAIALQQDGKIVVAGFAHVAVGGGTPNEFAVARYTTDGMLDTSSFGTNGSTTTLIGDGTDALGEAIALQQDGKIVVAGLASVGGDFGPYQFAVARYTTAGILDPSFGTNGSTTTPIGSGANTQGFAVTLQQDGKIVVAGLASVGGDYQFAVARYINPFTLSSFTASYGNVGLL